MTIRAMKRAAVVVVMLAVSAAAVGACGPDEPAAEPQASDEALEIAEETKDTVAALERRADDLESDLDRIAGARRTLEKKFDRVHSDLRDSIADLRASLSTAGDDASSARDLAQDALNKLDSLTERLSVLENRLDYHLRTKH